MEHISRVLPKVLHKRGLGAHAAAALGVHRATLWLRERLPDYASAMHVRSLKDGVLTIECTHAIASQECRGVSAELLAALQGDPPHAVKEVRIVRSMDNRAAN